MEEQKTILIVDDDQANVMFLSEIMDQKGHAYVVAKNGHEALEIVRKHNFDLIFLDIMMPLKSGIFVFKELKKDPNLKNLPVVIMTGAEKITGVNLETGEAKKIESYSDQYPRSLGNQIHKKLSKIKPDAFLEKPFTPAQVIEVLDNLLNSSRMCMGGAI